jgi:16S rRNA (cytidine1402-2'-O)-methyltransferase
MSKLYIVPTPIGNLRDMTFRAIRILKSRFDSCRRYAQAGKLLKHFRNWHTCTAIHAQRTQNFENLISRLKGKHL